MGGMGGAPGAGAAGGAGGAGPTIEEVFASFNIHSNRTILHILIHFHRCRFQLKISTQVD